jgi:endonuclease YncB( thermonuclease family)
MAIFTAAAYGSETITGKVIRVEDGDTLTISVPSPQGARQIRVQMHGVDCPEKEQPYSDQAKQFTTRMALGKTVACEVKSADTYDRMVVVAIVEGKNLNRELVKAGMAWWYRHYAPKDRELADMEEEARAAKRGLWADPTPMPPWEYRRLNRKR